MEELKKEFGAKFNFKDQPQNYDDWVENEKLSEIWRWVKSKLPKEVEIEPNCDDPSYICPNCKNLIMSDEDDFDTDGKYYAGNYCGHCGAKIKWI